MDTIANNQILNDTARFSVFNVVLPGNEFFQRVGNTIKMKSLRIEGFIDPTGANTTLTPPDRLRVAVVYDRQPNGAFPQYSDIWTSTSATGTTQSTSYDFTNPSNFDRFRVLRDMKIDLAPCGIVTAGVPSLANNPSQFVDTQHKYMVNMYIRLPNLESRFNTGTTGTISDIASGSLFMCVVTTNTTVTTPGWQFQFSSRLRYCD